MNTAENLCTGVGMVPWWVGAAGVVLVAVGLAYSLRFEPKGKR